MGILTGIPGGKIAGFSPFPTPSDEVVGKRENRGREFPSAKRDGKVGKGNMTTENLAELRDRFAIAAMPIAQAYVASLDTGDGEPSFSWLSDDESPSADLQM